MEVKHLGRIRINSEGFMRLTRRQMQFLETLTEIYNQSRKSVCYKDVAERLHVSKWTAYDIIQEINRKGYLNVEYKLNHGPGRSEVRFIPKETSIEKIKELEGTGILSSIKNFVSVRVKKYEGIGLSESIKLIAGKVEKEKNPLLVLLYAVTLFIIFSKIFKIDGIINISNVLSSGIEPQVILLFLVEMMLNLMAKESTLLGLSVDKPTLEKFRIIENKFKKSIGLVSTGSQRKVLTFLQSFS
jgi:energy-coupling factor transport system substrate-specific component